MDEQLTANQVGWTDAPHLPAQGDDVWLKASVIRVHGDPAHHPIEHLSVQLQLTDGQGVQTNPRNLATPPSSAVADERVLAAATQVVEAQREAAAAKAEAAQGAARVAQLERELAQARAELKAIEQKHKPGRRARS